MMFLRCLLKSRHPEHELDGQRDRRTDDEDDERYQHDEAQREQGVEHQLRQTAPGARRGSGHRDCTRTGNGAVNGGAG